MRVLFLNPPFLPKFSRSQRSPAVIRSGVLYYPLWLAQAAGLCEQHGYEIRLLDAPAARSRLEDVVAVSRSFAPQLIILDTSTPSIQSDIKVAEAIIETLHSTKQNVLIQRFVAESRGRDIRALVVGDRVGLVGDTTGGPDALAMALTAGKITALLEQFSLPSFYCAVAADTLVVAGKGEAGGLEGIFCEAADGHQRSTSPKTMSREPRMAETSASMWPLHRKSIACRCAKPGARSLQR